MRVLIVEDEPPNATRLTSLLQKIDSAMVVAGVCQSVTETLAWLGENPKPDLFLLDIHVADGYVFELFKTYKEDVPVIFVTAYDNYAIQAFKVNSLDYLLKPVQKEELQQALQKFKKQQSLKNTAMHPVLLELAGQLGKNYKTRFMVKLGDQVAAIRIPEIKCFHHEDGLVFLHRSDNKKFPVDFSLENLLELLDPSVFFRINRKTIVNIDHLGKMHVYFNSRLKLEVSNIPDDDCVVSRERTAEFKKWLDR
jgi:DNA-binding LytR/AlgR family response regulator